MPCEEKEQNAIFHAVLSARDIEAAPATPNGSGISPLVGLKQDLLLRELALLLSSARVTLGCCWTGGIKGPPLPPPLAHFLVGFL